MKRRRFHQYETLRPGSFLPDRTIRVTTPDEDGELVSSEVSRNIHLPVIDMDYRVTVKPSVSEGHHHMYIDKPVTWRAYKRLLRALLKADLIEKGWYLNALKDKRSYVYHPSYYQQKAFDILTHKNRKKGGGY